MPTAAWISISVTIGTFVLTHIVITVWWASRVNTLLDVVQENLKELVVEVKNIKNSFYTREDAAREAAIQEKENKAMWRKIDEIVLQSSKGVD